MASLLFMLIVLLKCWEWKIQKRSSRFRKGLFKCQNNLVTWMVKILPKKRRKLILPVLYQRKSFSPSIQKFHNTKLFGLENHKVTTELMEHETYFSPACFRKSVVHWKNEYIYQFRSRKGKFCGKTWSHFLSGERTWLSIPIFPTHLICHSCSISEAQTLNIWILKHQKLLFKAWCQGDTFLMACHWACFWSNIYPWSLCLSSLNIYSIAKFYA